MKGHQFFVIVGLLFCIQSNGETDKTMIAMTGMFGIVLVTVGFMRMIFNIKEK